MFTLEVISQEERLSVICLCVCRSLLLFLQSFLQEDPAENGEDRDSVQDRTGAV